MKEPFDPAVFISVDANRHTDKYLTFLRQDLLPKITWRA